MKKVNWIKIKNEYINTNIRYRSLADKHNIPFTTLRDRAIKEKWFQKRKEQRNKIGAKTEQKTAEKIIEANVSYAEQIISISEKTVEALDKAVGQLETMYIDGESVETGIVNTHKLRQIVQSLKELKDIFSSTDKGTEISGTTGVVVLPEVKDCEG